MYPELNCYDDFSTYSVELILHRRYCISSVRSESYVKIVLVSHVPLNFIIIVLLHQVEDFDNLRTREFEGNKNDEKARRKEKTENVIGGYRILALKYH